MPCKKYRSDQFRILTILLLFIIMASCRAVRNTLLVGTRLDLASINIYNALLSQSVFSPRSLSDGVYESRNENGKVILWVQDEALLGLNNVHLTVKDRFFADEKFAFDDIIFLSRHTAQSGTASLTVHPIGVPWLRKYCPKSGGVAGKCAPPNPFIAKLYRALMRETKVRGMDKVFQTTLEATHHGPYADIPAMFVEIGSTAEHWPIPEAGELWGHLLLEHLGLPWNADSGKSGSYSSDSNVVEKSPDMVLIVIGGSHYCPKMNDFCKLGDRALVGHCLASYAIVPLLDGTADDPPEGGYEAVLEETIASTRRAHPTAQLVILVDLKAEQRELILGHIKRSLPEIPCFDSFKKVQRLYKDTYE